MTTSINSLREPLAQVFKRRGSVSAGALFTWAEGSSGFLAGLGRFLDKKQKPRESRDYGNVLLREEWLPLSTAVKRLDATLFAKGRDAFQFGKFLGTTIDRRVVDVLRELHWVAGMGRLGTARGSNTADRAGSSGHPRSPTIRVRGPRRRRLASWRRHIGTREREAPRRSCFWRSPTHAGRFVASAGKERSWPGRSTRTHPMRTSNFRWFWTQSRDGRFSTQFDPSLQRSSGRPRRTHGWPRCTLFTLLATSWGVCE